MVILLKNRAAIYPREAAEMLHNISLYPGLTEDQLCRFFPEKEATAKTLLAHMLKEGRVYCAPNCRYYTNQEARNNADKDWSRCVWVLLDFIDQVWNTTLLENFQQLSSVLQMENWMKSCLSRRARRL